MNTIVHYEGDTEPQTRCGLVAIVGRANVGKSTYLNAALGQKLSITSRKPQTTRHRLLGIKNTPDAQLIFIDTPGFQIKPRRRLNRSMNREAHRAIDDVDVIVLMVEAQRWNAEDQGVCRRVAQARAPVLLAVNKVDRVSRKEDLLPYLDSVSKHAAFAEIVPVSAQERVNLDRLEACIVERLPPGPRLFPEDQLTDANDRFLCSEIIREKLMRQLGEELPYSVCVVIEQLVEEKSLLRIAATIWVEKASQKGIVIGAGGKALKTIATDARHELETFFGKRVHLETWVKVQERWADDAKALQQLGLDG